MVRVHVHVDIQRTKQLENVLIRIASASIINAFGWLSSALESISTTY